MEHRLDSGPQPPAIKRLLRRQGSREFFKGDGWTENPQEAATYADVLEAAESCVRHGLSEVELSLWVGGWSCEIFCTPIR